MLILIAKLLLLAGCGFLWRAGGSDKFPLSWRRFGVPVLIGVSAIISGNWLGLFSLPLLALAASLGYGVDSSVLKFWVKVTGKPYYETSVKMLTRATCGLAYSMAAIFLLWNNWWAYGFHILLTTSYVMLAGTQKFEHNDILEEGGIGVVFSFIPIWG